MAKECETAESLRKEGWILEEEAYGALGLQPGDLNIWASIADEHTSADGRNWVRLGTRHDYPLPEYSEELPVTPEPSSVKSAPAKRRRPSRCVSVKEAAQILGVCTKTIYNDLKYGRLRLAWNLRPYRIRREDVEKLIGFNRYAEVEARWRRQRRPKMRPYRRDGVPLVSDEEFKLCAPYEYMALETEKERIADWRERCGPQTWDYAKTHNWVEALLDEKRVITKQQAMDALDITSGAVFALVRNGKLMRIVQGRGPRRKALFSADQVEALAMERARADRRIGKTPAEWAHDLLRPSIRTKIEAPHGDRLISRAETAQILAVGLHRVGDLVRAGRLFAWQQIPGRKGSRQWFSYNQVNRYASSWDRVRRRRWKDGAGRDPIPENMVDPQYVWREEARMPPDRGRNLRRNHGDYFSARQAAQELGISLSTVYVMRTRGQLLGYQIRGRKRVKYPWWFFLKEDVWALKEDPRYAERSRRSREAHRTRTSPQ